MEYLSYKISSYDEYYKKHLPKIKKLCRDKDVHIAYIMALNEAVCNAFRYNVEGEYKGNAEINMIVSCNDIMCRIYADTMSFDVIKYYRKIQELAANPETGKMDWGVYTQNKDGGRGLWYMLYGSDVLQIDIKTYEVSLFISFPSAGEERTKKIKNLAKRFFIKKNGVVL